MTKPTMFKSTTDCVMTFLYYAAVFGVLCYITHGVYWIVVELITKAGL